MNINSNHILLVVSQYRKIQFRMVQLRKVLMVTSQVAAESFVDDVFDHGRIVGYKKLR